MSVLATVITPGYVANPLVLWLIEQEGLRFTTLEEKPRERAKMAAMRVFLNSQARWWMLVNHYASPQFRLEEVPFDRAVIAASMRRPVGPRIEPIRGEVIGEDGAFIQSDFVPTGCLFLRRDAVEAVAESRPFEYRHAPSGALLGSGDRTLSEALWAAGYDLWIWKRRCALRQECWI